MADKKISQLTALAAANLAPSTDVLAIVDTSATETKKIVAQDLINGVLNVASAVGIGTSSPSTKLTVYDATTPQVTFNNGTSTFIVGNNSGGNNKILYGTGAYPMIFYTNATEAMQIDASQNLGLGVTPSLWQTGAKAVEIGGSGYLAFTGSTNGGYLYSNAYLAAGGNTYKAAGYAAAYGLGPSGQHQWFIAPSWNGTGSNAISFTQAMTLDASGNLGVGTTAASNVRLHTYNTASIAEHRIECSTTAGVFSRWKSSAGDIGYFGQANVFVGGASSSDLGVASAVGNIVFATGATPAERGRFTAGGFFKASNTGTYANSTNDRYEFSSDKDDINIIVRTTSTGASVVNLYSQFPAGPTAGAYHFAGAIAGSGYQFTVDADGDVKNTNGSYAAISDVKLKQDIEDAASQWDDIKSVRVRKYRFKRTPDAPLQIGVIAQELEQTSPGLVSEDADRDEENNDLGTTTKSVKYSILYMKAIKALQEAMARIESLEAKVSALEAK